MCFYRPSLAFYANNRQALSISRPVGSRESRPGGSEHSSYRPQHYMPLFCARTRLLDTHVHGGSVASGNRFRALLSDQILLGGGAAGIRPIFLFSLQTPAHTKERVRVVQTLGKAGAPVVHSKAHSVHSARDPFGEQVTSLQESSHLGEQVAKAARLL